MKVLRSIASAFAHAALALLTFAVAGRALVSATPLPDMTRFLQRSQMVTAIDGVPLWGFLAPDGRWRLLATASDVDPGYLKTLIAYEDKRFRVHPGIDPLAMTRAVFDALRRGRLVSGGSTLTMQTVRLLEPQPRTLAAKFDQILKALKMERAFNKDQILTTYLTLAPFGGNLDGVRAASLTYLGKEPKRLSPGETAMLVAIPQAPEERRPDRWPSAAQRAKVQVVRTLLARGAIDPRSARLAQSQSPTAAFRPFQVAAPYFAQRVRSMAARDRETLRSLIDRDLQRNVERIVHKAIGQWDEGVNIAVVVLRNRDASVAAYVGGANFGTISRAGYVDLARAVRSPGSALKPFIYSIAFEKSIVRPDTTITDKPVEIDGYRPDNADGKFMGDLTVRQALVRSRNTIAVTLLKQIGVEEMLGRFRATGRPLVLPEFDPSAGLATALGGEGVTLEQLTWFYTAFARDGKLGALRFTDNDPVVVHGALMSRYAARATADVLADVPPPASFERLTAQDGSRRIGFKTGTSYGFRDAWAVGFDELHTVGVWVGRPDGAAHLGAYGVTAAAPLLMQVFEALPPPADGIRSVDSEFPSLSANSPPRLARFDAPTGAIGTLSVFYPQRGATIDSGAQDDVPVRLTLTAEGGKGPYAWELPGRKHAETDGESLTWSFETRGQCVVRVTDSTGDSAETSFWLN